MTALSEAEFVSRISQLFDLSGPYPLHSLLSDAADEILTQPPITFTGFSTHAEKLYVILIVALFSTAIVLMVVVISVFSEDKVMRMVDKRTKRKIESQKGPSLFTQIQGKKLTSSYSSFNQLKKRHSTQEPLREPLQEPLREPLQEPLREEPSHSETAPVGKDEDTTAQQLTNDAPMVTHTEITLADLTES
jgi:hypothetical protein